MTENSSSETYSDCEQLVESPQSRPQHEAFIPVAGGLNAPSDRWNVIYIAFVVAGTGFLFPYNSFITAVDYFQSIYPGERYEFFVTLVYFYTTLSAVFFNNVVVRVIGLKSRIRLSYALFCFPLVAVMVLSAVITREGTDATFAVTMIGVATVSFAGGAQQASFYGFAGMLPRKYTQAVMTGESAAGLAVSIDRIITKAAFQSCRTSALVFFGIALVFNVLCALLYEFVQRTSFVRYHTMSTCQSNTDHAAVYRPLNSENSVELVVSGVVGAEQNKQSIQVSSRSGLVSRFKKGWHARKLISQKLWRLMLAISLIYFVTLLLFPGMLSEVKGGAFQDDWLPVILIGLFNLFDFIGKLISVWHYEWKEQHLIAIGLVRFILIPLLVLCTVPCQSPAFGSASAYVAMALSATLGVSNGYFGCMAMVLSPSRVEPQLREVAGNLMTLMILVGLTAGATMAFLLNYLTGSETSSLCFNSNSTDVSSGTCWNTTMT